MVALGGHIWSPWTKQILKTHSPIMPLAISWKSYSHCHYIQLPCHCLNNYIFSNMYKTCPPIWDMVQVIMPEQMTVSGSLLVTSVGHYSHKWGHLGNWDTWHVVPGTYDSLPWPNDWTSHDDAKACQYDTWWWFPVVLLPHHVIWYCTCPRIVCAH